MAAGGASGYFDGEPRGGDSGEDDREASKRPCQFVEGEGGNKEQEGKRKKESTKLKKAGNFLGGDLETECFQGRLFDWSASPSPLPRPWIHVGIRKKGR